MVLGDDPDLEPTDEELEAEEEEEPIMQRDAAYWDAFLALVDILQEPWAEPAQDTRAFREARAIKVFNAGMVLCPLHCCCIAQAHSSSSQQIYVHPQVPRSLTS